MALEAQEHRPATPDHLQHRFDDPSRYAKAFDDPSRDTWQMPARVLDALRLQADASVADIGAGTGYFSVRLAKAVPDGTVYAVDIEPAMLAHVRTRATTERLANIVPVQASSASPDLPALVDLALVVNTYHHLPGRSVYFSRLKRALTPSARVVIIDFRKDAPEGPPVEFRLEPEQIVAEMKLAGYELDATHGFLPRQHFLVFRPAIPR